MGVECIFIIRNHNKSKGFNRQRDNKDYTECYEDGRLDFTESQIWSMVYVPEVSKIINNENIRGVNEFLKSDSHLSKNLFYLL